MKWYTINEDCIDFAQEYEYDTSINNRFAQTKGG